MSIALTEDHRALAETAAAFLARRDARTSARSLLEAPDEGLPSWWAELADLGWLGLHVPEEFGGSGYTLEETAVVIEQLGRAVAPGPFVPTVIASAVLAACGGTPAKDHVPGMTDGSTIGAVALGSAATVVVKDGKASGQAGNVLGGGLANVILVASGDDVAVVDVAEAGDTVTVEVPRNMDPTRRTARVTLESAPVTVLPGARRVLVDLARVVLAAEAVGLARECTDMAAAYSKERLQFGRPIAMFQAVKHHCANMAVATELATSAVWDAAKAASTGGDQLSYAAAVAATLAGPAADLCANLNTQVHGGIAITWEHDAHLFMRRATVLLGYLDPEAAAIDLTDLVRRGVTRAKTVELPPEAEAIRDEVRAFADSIKGKSESEQRDALIKSGYVMPHWPRPYGREAGAVEQLVVEQEFVAAGINSPRVRHHRLGHPHPDPVRHRRSGRALGVPCAQPRRRLVPAVLRARCRVGRRRHQDQGHPCRRWLARERPEGVDQWRARRRHGVRDRAHQSRRAEARRHHDDGDRHARRRRRGATAAHDERRL